MDLSVSPPYRRHEQQNTAPFHCFLVFHPGQETNRANRLATGFWCLPPPAIPSMDDWPRVPPGLAGRCQVCPPKTVRLGSEDALRLLSPSAGKDKWLCREQRRGSQSNSWKGIQVDAWSAPCACSACAGQQAPLATRFQHRCSLSDKFEDSRTRFGHENLP
jgi:hypothetical protein